jgi:hypothetical protein
LRISQSDGFDERAFLEHAHSVKCPWQLSGWHAIAYANTNGNTYSDAQSHTKAYSHTEASPDATSSPHAAAVIEM